MSGRTWVKLWVREWLEGTTRYEMSGAQRAFWIDLLAMAGRSSVPGIICAGRTGDQLIGYPLAVLSALDAGGEIDVQATLALFEAAGKIQIQVTAESPVKLLKIQICNWDRYQSEYCRQSRYRFKQKRLRQKVTTKVTREGDAQGDGHVDANGDGDTEVRSRELKPSCEPDGSHVSVSPEPDPKNGVRAASDQAPNPKTQVVHNVFKHHLQRLDKNPCLYKFTPLRKQKGMARLEDALEIAGGDLTKAEALMMLAVDNLAASNFHRGKNDSGKRYDSWEKNLFKSREQFEGWLE